MLKIKWQLKSQNKSEQFVARCHLHLAFWPGKSEIRGIPFGDPIEIIQVLSSLIILRLEHAVEVEDDTAELMSRIFLYFVDVYKSGGEDVTRFILNDTWSSFFCSFTTTELLRLAKFCACADSMLATSPQAFERMNTEFYEFPSAMLLLDTLLPRQ